MINRHIARVYDLMAAAGQAANSNLQGPALDSFRCAGIAKLAAAVVLHGIVNSVASEVDKGIEAYKKIKACTPGADPAIKTLKGIRRNIGNSPLGSDAIAGLVALFVKETMRGGSILSFFIGAGYKLYDENRPGIDKVLPR